MQAAPALAVTSSTLNFQGRLTSNTGALILDGSYNIEFRLYDDALAGANLWTENRTGGSAVTVRNGYFSVYLGEVTPFGASIPWDQELWMTMNVNADGEMTPRFKLTATPYAFRAGAVTDSLGNAFTGDDLIQKAPSSVQTVNSALAAIRLNQAGSGSLLQLQGDGANVFTVAKNGATTIGAGLTLGNSTSTTAGTIRWTGTDFEGYNGISWVSLTSGSGGGGALTFDSFYAYDAVGNIDISAGWTDIRLDTEVKKDAPYTHAANAPAVTINDTGWYEITYNISTYSVTGGNAQASTQAKLQENTGGGFTDIPGTFGFMFLRSGGADANASATITREFTAGDIVKLQAQRASGTLTTLTNPNSVGLTIRKIVDAGSGGGSSTAFEQGGNSFGATAVLGTTDANGLTFITNNAAALSITSGGVATFSNALTVTSGGLSVSGNSSIAGSLSGLTGLSFASGNIALNGGSITGLGPNITGLNGLTISSGGSGNLTLESASGLLLLNANTLQRIASGTTSIDLTNASNTTLQVTNSGTGIANLSVQGLVTANSFSGSGSGITGLNASNITTGTLADGLLSNNVALLNTAQTFSGLQTFSSGLIVGNTSSAIAGALRWTGVDLEVYDGTAWVSLTSGGSGGGTSLLEGVLAFGKVDSTGTPLNVSGATVTRNSLGSYTVTLATVAADANYTILVSLADASGFNDPNIAIVSQTTAGFSVEIRIGDNGAGADDLADRVWYFTVIDSNAVAGGSSGSSGLEFVQNGNAFGSTAILGTTDNNGLNLITNGTTAFSIDSLGEATFMNSLTVNQDFFVNGSAQFNGGTLTVGSSVQPGLLQLSDGSSNAGTIQTGSLSANRIYVLPDQDGTICLSSGNCGAAGNFAELGGNTVTGAMVLGTNNAEALVFKTANTNRLNIDTAGNVNVINGALQTSGTTRLTTAGALQNITGLSVISSGASIIGNSSITGTLGISNTLTVSSGGITVTLGGLSIVGGINNNNGGITNAGAVAGATTITASGDINTTAGGLQTNSITRLTNSGALQNITTITASGNIDTTGGVYQVNGVDGVSGDCTTGGNNSYLNNIVVSGGIITQATCRSTGATLSDERLKENVVSLNSSILDNIGLVNTVNFDFKCEEEFLSDFDVDCDSTQTGVIAQELAAIFPELVYQGDDGYYRVKYDALNIYTLKAVSELSKTINSLGDVKANTVSTSDSIRITKDGKLQNINGLVLQSGGASIVGGIDNNFGGLSNVGDVLGASTIEAQQLRLETNSQIALNLTKDSQDVFTLYNNGALQMRLDSARAFSIADAQGIDLFNVNTEGGLVQIGRQNSSPTAILFILSRKNTPGDPVGVNGAQYYNEFLQRFRCFQDDMWVDCVPASVSEYIVVSSAVSWTQPVEETEVAGNSRTWLDLRAVREVRAIVSVEEAGIQGATCQLQYQIEGQAAWKNLAQNSVVSIEESSTVRSNWAQIAEDVRAQEEVQIRFVCGGGNGEQQIKITTVRLQVR